MTKLMKKEGGLMAELSNMQSDGGFVQVRKDLISIPRLQLGQAMSDTVQAQLGKAGEFMSKVKGKNYGASVKIIPILISESAAYIDKETSKLICRTDNLVTNMDGIPCKQCPYGQYWNDWSDGKKPECRSSIDVICIVNDEMDMPQVLSFRKTSYRAGKSLLNLIMHDKYKVPFGSVYELKSKFETKDSYKYYVIEETIIKEQLPESKISEIIPIAKNLLDMKNKGKLQHEEEDSVVEVVKPEETPTEQEDLPI